MSLVPAETPVEGAWHDRVRLALPRCTMIAGSFDKRFSAHVGTMRLGAITECQWRQVMRLAWRYRRQLPSSLVPPRDQVIALDRWTPRPARQIERDPRQGDLETHLWRGTD